MRYLLPTVRPIVEDLAGTLAFYLLYLLTGSATLGVAIGLLIGFAQIGLHLRRGESVPTLLAAGVLLTLVLGLLSWLVEDVRLVLAKPSLIYAAIGITMLPRGWVTRYVPSIALELLPRRTFDRVGWSWAALMFATAGGNLLLVGTLPPRTAAACFAAGAAASKLLLFAGQYAVLRRRAARMHRIGAASDPRSSESVTVLPRV